MDKNKRIQRFSVLERIFHLSLMLTFLVQAVTGFSRLYITTAWGAKMVHIIGGYETSLTVHKWVGSLMIAGFLIHIIYLLMRMDWRAPLSSLFGPDSIVPNLQDMRNFKQRILWSIGLGSEPKFDRWTYFEKFDYWAVFWGLPILALTGLMTMFPQTTCKILPGWSLNIAVLLHRAEAILAVTYIFVVHFYVGHLRPSSFPMNEAMFAGSVALESAMAEKSLWVQRLQTTGKLRDAYVGRPSPWYRKTYFVFGYAVLLTGIYFLVNGLIYSRAINLH